MKISSPFGVLRQLTSLGLHIGSHILIWKAKASLEQARRQISDCENKLIRLRVTYRSITRNKSCNSAVKNEFLRMIEDAEGEILHLTTRMTRLQWCLSLDTPAGRQKALKEILASHLLGA